MMEKSVVIYSTYQKKITAYLDGTLSLNERSEFEAFVAVHPEFKSQIETKEEELQKLRQSIPTIVLSPRSRESLETEMKQSVYNLLQRESRSFWQRMKDRFEEWANR